MQVIEQQCPHCNARLRLRGPAQTGQNLPCPDCAKPLIVEATGTGVRLAAIAPEPTSRPDSAVRVGSGRSPTVIAWCVATIVMLPVGWSLLAPDQPEAEPIAANPAQATAAPTPLESEATVSRSNEPDEPSVAAAPKSNNTEQPVSIDAAPPPDETPEPIQEANTDATVDEQDEQDRPGILPVPAEAAERVAAEAAKEAEAIASIRQRLSVRLAVYEMPRPIELRVFLNEISRLSATWINTNGLASQLQKPVQLNVRDKTLEHVLSEGLMQAGFRFEVLPTGIHLSALP